MSQSAELPLVSAATAGASGAIRVTFKAFSVIRDVMGAELLEVEIDPPGTMQKVMDALLGHFGENLKEKLWDPEEGDMTPFLIRLNDEVIRSRFDMDTPVANGDLVAFIFPIGGG